MKTKTQLNLYGETFSPWTKKARWALEYCGLEYTYREYTPTLSEPALRWRLKQWAGPVSVPVMFSERKVYRDSWDIACYANKVSANNRLGDMSAIAAWNTLSENALAEGRIRILRSLLDNNGALEEGLPKFVPNFLRRPLRFVALDAVKRLDRKYAHLLKTNSLERALDATREGLLINESGFLLGNFSYADITMAAVLEMIAPIARADPPLGPATEKLWRDQSLADQYPDLIDWRDRLASNANTRYSQFD